MRKKNSERNTFWQTDISDIEAKILGEGKEISDLPIFMDDRVPSQGSVLLPRARKVEADKQKDSSSRCWLFKLFN